MTQIEEMPPTDTEVGNFTEKAVTRGQSGLLLVWHYEKTNLKPKIQGTAVMAQFFNLKKSRKCDFQKENGKQKISFSKFCMNTFFSFPL